MICHSDAIAGNKGRPPGSLRFPPGPLPSSPAPVHGVFPFSIAFKKGGTRMTKEPQTLLLMVQNVRLAVRETSWNSSSNSIADCVRISVHTSLDQSGCRDESSLACFREAFIDR